VLASVMTKREEQIEELENIDGKNQFKTLVTKWKHIIMQFMKVGCCTHPRNGPTCKNKWDVTIGDFKNIYDYKVRIGHNAYY
jgi:hypothetical protein